MAPPSYPPVPPRDDLGALSRAALSNAHDLLGDAQRLADTGSHPRAHSLATLAWEELSKAQLCLLAMLLSDITPEDFWKSFRSHEGKLARVHAVAGLMRPEPVGPVSEYVKSVVGQSASAAKQRERGLYVDYRRGRILLPSQIGEQAAKRHIQVVREALAFADSAFILDDLDDMVAQVIDMRDRLKAANAADPDALAAALQQAVQGGSQEALQALVEQATVTGRDEA